VLASGLLSAKSSHWLKTLPTQLVCCLHKHLSQQWFLFFPVHNPCPLVISFTAFIHIVCCLKLYLRETMLMGFVFFLRMSQDKCNADCNRDCFQCNRNRLHLCCNRSVSASDNLKWNIGTSHSQSLIFFIVMMAANIVMHLYRQRAAVCNNALSHKFNFK